MTTLDKLQQARSLLSEVFQEPTYNYGWFIWSDSMLSRKPKQEKG